MGQPVVIQIVGYKNSGKTTLVSHLVSALKKQGYQVGTVKHDAHHFKIDHMGTDTWQHRQAGADTVAITSDEQTAVLEQKPTSVRGLLERMGPLDFVLIEGFKTAPFPKIVMIKEEADQELLRQLENVIVAARWQTGPDVSFSPVYAIDDIEQILHVMMNVVK